MIFRKRFFSATQLVKEANQEAPWPCGQTTGPDNIEHFSRLDSDVKNITIQFSSGHEKKIVQKLQWDRLLKRPDLSSAYPVPHPVMNLTLNIHLFLRSCLVFRLLGKQYNYRSALQALIYVYVYMYIIVGFYRTVASSLKWYSFKNSWGRIAETISFLDGAWAFSNAINNFV